MKKRNPNKKKKRKLVRCENCKNIEYDFGNNFNDNIKCYCEITKKGILDEKKEIQCGNFNNKYIEYPLYTTIVKIAEYYEKAIVENSKTGSLVKVRPCEEKYENKTFLGIYIGEGDIGLGINFHRKTKELQITRHRNPIIFVPKLKKIIYGAGSWWTNIKDEKDLKDITDEDINNTWYVQLLKSMENKKNEEKKI